MPNDSPIAPDGTGLDRIDPHSDAALVEWAKKLDVSERQLEEAIAAVGDLATDVELYLKGTRSTTNTQQVDEAGKA